MQHYIRELQRQPYYRTQTPPPPQSNYQQRFAFEAQAAYEEHQRLMYERRMAEQEMLESFGGDGDSRRPTQEKGYMSPTGGLFISPTGEIYNQP